jgi:hypothetical protein
MVERLPQAIPMSQVAITGWLQDIAERVNDKAPFRFSLRRWSRQNGRGDIRSLPSQPMELVFTYSILALANVDVTPATIMV